MKQVFVGTKLDADVYREFSVIAAQRGLSRSALLKFLVVILIAKESTPGASRRKPTTKGRTAA